MPTLSGPGQKLAFAAPGSLKLDAPQRIVEGYAAAWAVDRIGDRIQKGAFADSIRVKHREAQKKTGRGEIRVLWQHALPLGVLRDIKEDDYGLWIKAYICRTALGDEALELLREGAVDRMSIGFNVEDWEPSENPRDDIRVIKKADLWEVSFVTFPANMAAVVEAVKEAHPQLCFLDLPILTRKEDDDVSHLETKAGRKISKARQSKLEAALEALSSAAGALGEVLKEVGDPDEGDDDDDEEKGGSGADSPEDLEDPKRRKNPANAKSLCAHCQKALSDQDEEKAAACKECGGVMKDGACTKCGWTSEKPKKKSDDGDAGLVLKSLLTDLEALGQRVTQNA